jgi:hypothetical protein
MNEIACSVTVSEDLDPVAFARDRLKIDPDPYQIEILRSNPNRGIFNCSRQSGKSTVAAAAAIHRAYSRPGCTILVASPSERQSAEFIRKCAGMLTRLGIAPRGDGDNEISLLFPNGARIVGLPGNEANVRGFSAVSLIIIDEASVVDDSMYKALLPMLGVGNGDLWIMSTPRGKRGFFYETWRHGGPGWLRISITAPECPRMSSEFLEMMRGDMGPAWFAQEFMAEFVDNGQSVFALDQIEKAIDDSIEPLVF